MAKMSLRPPAKPAGGAKAAPALKAPPAKPAAGKPAPRPLAPPPKKLAAPAKPAPRALPTKPVAAPAAARTLPAKKPVAAPAVTARPAPPQRKLVAPPKRTAPEEVQEEAVEEEVADGEALEVEAEVVAEEEVQEEPSGELMEQQSADLVPSYESTGGIGQVEGELDTTDFTRPRLEFVQNVGPLVEEYGFTVGDIVFAKEVPIWTAERDPLRVIILTARKMFTEVLPYGSEEMPRLFQNAEEVREAGLWLEWQGDERPPAAPILIALILVEKPDDIESDQFMYEHGDKVYGLAEWRISGSAYKTAGRYILTAAKTTLKNGTHTGILGMSARREKRGKNTITVPYLKYAEATPQDLIEFCESLVQ